MTSNAWALDILNRKRSADFLSTYLVNRYQRNLTPDLQDSFVLAINADWGFGKTFLLKNWMQDLENGGHPVVYFDAWKNDYTHEPLISFIAEIETQLLPRFSKSPVAKKLFESAIEKSKRFIRPAATSIIEIIVKRLTHLTTDEIKEIYGDSAENSDESDDSIDKDVSSLLAKCADEALKEHKNIQESIEAFKKNLNALVSQLEKSEKIQLPIFILVDELDRCRPTFSIQLLEIIKHLFGVPGVYFVIATNIDQLSHSVNAVYGEGFNSESYLKRFFDQEYVLPQPDTDVFSNYLLTTLAIKDDPRIFTLLDAETYGKDKNLAVETFALLAKYFHLGLRDQEQIANTLSAIIIIWPYQFIHLFYLLILIIAKHRSMNLYKKLANIHHFGHEQMQQVFTDLRVDRSILLKRSGWNQEGRKQDVSVHIQEAFWHYNSNANIDMALLGNKERPSSFPQRDMVTVILREMPSSYRTNQAFPSSLTFYSSLVDQVGDLIT